eukprot:6720483-Ditylum_brightwellii.AAC.1
MSACPEKEYPLVLANNAKLTATRESGDFFNVSVKKMNSNDKMMASVVDSIKHGIESSECSGVFQNIDVDDVARTSFHIPKKNRKL